jgi:hypothetical protein
MLVVVVVDAIPWSSRIGLRVEEEMRPHHVVVFPAQRLLLLLRRRKKYWTSDHLPRCSCC